MKFKVDKKLMVRAFSFGVAVLLFVISASSALGAVAAPTSDYSDYETVITETGDDLTYAGFLEQHKETNAADKQIVIDGASLVASENSAEPQKVEEVDAYILNSENGWLEYNFTVEQAGIYNIAVDYCPVKETSRNIQLGFLFDGKYPYRELTNVIFTRFWVDEERETAEFEKDEEGNEIRPNQVETYHWSTSWVKSFTGMYNDPFGIYLEAGDHTLRLVRETEAIAISNITLKKYEKAPSYKDYLENNSDKKQIKVDSDYIIEAESAFEKNDNRLAATYNSANAGMSPASPTTTVINSFGQDYWKNAGQAASWKVSDDLKAGMYVLRFRARQNGSVGITTFRRLTINGQVPFKEAESIAFEYHDGWFVSTAGGEENPYLFYLEPGDTLTLEATTGIMSEAIRKINSSVNSLNEIYQSIIIVTGIEPDEDRDYNIHKEVPTLLDDLAAVRDEIDEIDELISGIMGETNSKTYFFREFSARITKMIKNYHTIIPELATFKSQIDSYVAQTYDFNSLQLELDYIAIMTPESDAPKAGVGFWKSVVFEFKRFIYSFSEDYVPIDEKGKKTLTVWTSLGRDQAQAVKRLIEQDFSSKYDNINVKLIIAATSLPQAILAGVEPDVQLNTVQGDPINLALRGQLVDLKPYIDKLDKEYLDQIPDAAWTPFIYDGGIYALPTTMDYSLMFYRSDILAKLGVELPETWDEFYGVVRELQKNKYQVGMREASSDAAGVSTAIPFFQTFLYQRGGKYYNDDLTQTDFESKAGKEAFVQLVELYRDYALETDFDPVTRFRSGEMPIIIGSYGHYMQFSAIATEIEGRWGMTVLPGTVKEDGSIDRTTIVTSSGSIILKGAEKRGVVDEAFEFIKWFASASSQQSYSEAMESIQGIAGRVAVANTEAFENIGWSEAEKSVLRAQRDQTIGIEEVPGNYIISRHISNALRSAYQDGEDPLRQLNIQNRFINQELIRKRAEFEDMND